ncbi:hypothetical protein F2Q65_12205 [Thiohalocapsa marina]|uniref:Uncharacterized protein n=1 Tax=Thiohalocapsa marina TaxID=424902 RepID=A0A5M8FS24_9GAMM|nr:hypothetical protein F2Q65_12205 [Thiohalocapsa marina]
MQRLCKNHGCCSDPAPAAPAAPAALAALVAVGRRRQAAWSS